MSREAVPSNNERDFVVAALRQGVRLDTRAFDQFRQISLEFGDQHGTAEVRIGKTKVLCKIHAEVVPTYPDRKFDGIFTISTELSPMASPAFDIGRHVCNGKALPLVINAVSS